MPPVALQRNLSRVSVREAGNSPPRTDHSSVQRVLGALSKARSGKNAECAVCSRLLSVLRRVCHCRKASDLQDFSRQDGQWPPFSLSRGLLPYKAAIAWLTAPARLSCSDGSLLRFADTGGDLAKSAEGSIVSLWRSQPCSTK